MVNVVKIPKPKGPFRNAKMSLQLWNLMQSLEFWILLQNFEYHDEKIGK